MNEYRELIEECSYWISIGDEDKCPGITKHLKELKCAIEQLLEERESAERKRQTKTKLKAIKDLCMSVPDCGVCLLSIGKTCPTKFWHDWTPEEIETAFDIIYGGEVDDAES